MKQLRNTAAFVEGKQIHWGVVAHLPCLED